MNHHSSYLSSVFRANFTLRGKVDRICEDLTAKLGGLKVDSIAVTGVSGMAVGSAVAYVMGLNLIVVRKTMRSKFSHAEMPIEGLPVNAFNYVIVDDIIDSGKTIAKMTRSLSKEKGTLKGVYLYGNARFWKPELMPMALVKWRKVYHKAIDFVPEPEPEVVVESDIEIIWTPF